MREIKIIMGQDKAVGLLFEADSNKQGGKCAVFKSIPVHSCS